MIDIERVGNDKGKFNFFSKRSNTSDDALDAVKSLIASGDETSAFEMCRRAAVKGEIKTMTFLGLMYLRGTGVEQDVLKAMFWFEKAHKAGDPAAPRMLGLMHLDGQYIKPDKKLGELYIEISAMRGDGIGQCLFSIILRHKNNDRWLKFLQMSADSGCAEGKRELAKAHLDGCIPDADPAVGITLLKSAADDEDAGALARLALELVKGTNIERSYSDAIKLCRKSVEKGDVDGMTLLGRMLMDGLGCHASVEAGAKWLRRAAERGSKEAEAILCSMPTDSMCQTDAIQQTYESGEVHQS